MNQQEAAAILARLAVAYPQSTVDAMTAQTWAQHLATVPFDQGMAVVDTLIQTARFFPSIAEFRENWMVARRAHRFDNPFELGADHLYAKLPPDEAAERWQDVKTRLADHPTAKPVPIPGKPERTPGPPPPPCTEHDHSWCHADDVQRRTMDPDRWQHEREEARKRWLSHGPAGMTGGAHA